MSAPDVGSPPSVAPVGPRATASPTGARSQAGDRLLIFSQLAFGVGLVVFGALLAALSKAATHDIGTAVIGVGAALIPAGAAASASARILQTLSAAPVGNGTQAGGQKG